MCIRKVNANSITSIDGILLITYCRECIEVHDVASMEFLQSYVFDDHTTLHIEENKNGNFEISGEKFKLKYVRKLNEFVEDKCGINVFIEKCEDSSVRNLVVRNNGMTIFDCEDVLKDFIMYGKKNIYYIKVNTINEDMTATCKVNKLTFNIKMNRFETTVSDTTFHTPGKYARMVLDKNTGRLLVGNMKELIVFNMHNLKEQNRINNCFHFDKNYALIRYCENKTIGVDVIDMKNDNRFNLTTNCPGFMSAAIDGSHILLYTHVMFSPTYIYDVKDPNGIIKHDSKQDYSMYVSEFRVLEKLNKMLIVGDDSILTFSYGLHKLLAFGQFCVQTPVCDFVSDLTFDRHLLLLVDSFVGTQIQLSL